MDSQEILRVALYVDGPADAQKIHHVIFPVWLF